MSNGAEFSTATTLEVAVDQGSLRQARQDVESSLGEVTVGGRPGSAARADGGRRRGGSRIAGRERAMQRQLLSENIDLDERRNELLEQLLEEEEKGNVTRARMGGGAATAGLIGLGLGAAGLGSALRNLGDFELEPPDIPPLEIPSLPKFEWPALPAWDWPPIPEPEWTPLPIERPGSIPVDEPDPVPVEDPGPLPVDAPTSIPVDAPTSIPVDAPTSIPVTFPTDAPGPAGEIGGIFADPAGRPSPSPAPTGEPSPRPDRGPTTSPDGAPLRLPDIGLREILGITGAGALAGSGILQQLGRGGAATGGAGVGFPAPSMLIARMFPNASREALQQGQQGNQARQRQQGGGQTIQQDITVPVQGVTERRAEEIARREAEQMRDRLRQEFQGSL